VLENITASLILPNILDVKLGTVLYDIDASEEKKVRSEAKAIRTTSRETGIRLTGFQVNRNSSRVSNTSDFWGTPTNYFTDSHTTQVYDHDKKAPEITPKSYGYSLKSSELHEGIAKVFPLSPSSTGKPEGQGLPRELLMSVLRGIKSEIEKIRSTLDEMEFTMIGGSLLIAYEADWERVSSGLEYLANRDPNADSESEEEEEEEEEEGSEQSTSSKQGRESKPGPPYKVRLIDFAHFRFMPGQGPDRRMLKGIDTILRLLDGRIEELTESTPEK
jgi:inositol-polyphosphate multikinase